ncbi:hypothetical protein mRhiFer1_010222 [Rhinolophus ferrumequinum]|uniref:Uncharacterized protein n=1 Tax=Rhinolophus ferrumequinum TaxID=59479 RepID=A0A7J7X5A1_RHIFE|nr:hypothetical protein mRhiFer1_010222 [Rhinolophus ferrumequinum]
MHWRKMRLVRRSRKRESYCGLKWSWNAVQEKASGRLLSRPRQEAMEKASGSLGVSDGSFGDEDKASGTIVEREGGTRVRGRRGPVPAEPAAAGRGRLGHALFIAEPPARPLARAAAASVAFRARVPGCAEQRERGAFTILWQLRE